MAEPEAGVGRGAGARRIRMGGIDTVISEDRMVRSIGYRARWI